MRLSRDNVASNAAAIADYLALTPADRAITTLPLHYCYGLSVLHSHLVAGASVVLTDLSVVDECFWDLVRRAPARPASPACRTPSTCWPPAASRPATCRRCGRSPRPAVASTPTTYAAGAGSAASRGWDLVVMYGATEATARMA